MSVYIHPHTCVYTCICKHIRRHTYMHIHTYAHAHMHAYMHTHIHMHVYAHLYTDRNINMYIRMYIYMYIHELMDELLARTHSSCIKVWHVSFLRVLLACCRSWQCQENSRLLILPLTMNKLHCIRKEIWSVSKRRPLRTLRFKEDCYHSLAMIPL